MATMLQEIADHLVAHGLAEGATGWGLFQTALPAEPDRAVALFDGPGLAPGGRHTVERPALQVRVRGVAGGYAEARAKIDAIWTLLHAFTGTIGATAYSWILASGSVESLGYDGNERPELVANFDVMRSR